VLTITTQERDNQIARSSALRSSIEALKSNWLIGLHHNWHDHAFKYDPLFDFSMAGEGDLIEVNGTDVPLITMDACNFVPPTFQPGNAEKFWDVLYVARAVFFKRIPEFFQTVRTLYDQGHLLRVLFICPVPPFDPTEKKTVFYDIREVYDSLFSESEKKLFTLLTIDYLYPFPFDLETLSYFYRSSKIFVHSADDERRCRVAAYAWASGLPVVAMDCVSGLLAPERRREPYFYAAATYADFPVQIVRACQNLSLLEWDAGAMKRQFIETDTVHTLNVHLGKFALANRRIWDDVGISGANLSIRLGRHHLGKSGPNSLKLDLSGLIGWLPLHNDVLSQLLRLDDPESGIEKLATGTDFLTKVRNLVSYR
jgi:glycosyltransferase involved in cell wall biosynthesis